MTFDNPLIQKRLIVAGYYISLLLMGIMLTAGIASAGDDPASSGRELYQRHCATCHGPDGTGAPSSTVGFKLPLPDFTDCNFASRETAMDWIMVAGKGGPARGFSNLMPAFGDALSEAELSRTVAYVRDFCANPEWPLGELNLPRPLVTTKAYPEDELVLAMEIHTEGANRISNQLIYEQRFGARNQFEFILPFGWSEQDTEDGTTWTSSVGDIAIGLKRVMFYSLESGAIVTLGGELLLPTGDDEEGFGSDTMTFEPYVSYGQLLPAQWFLEFQAGGALPFDTDRQNEEVFWRGVVGRMIYTGSYGRRWSPMVEVTGAKELASGTDTDWNLVPQLQVTLNTRQHVRLGLGAQIPLNNTDQREPTYMAYLLWDWFDGGFFDGW